MKKYTIYIYKGFKPFPIEVEGTPLKLINSIETFVHKQYQRTDLNDKPSWSVSEVTTGHSLAFGATRKKAIENAKEQLLKVSPEELQIALEKARKTLSTL